MIEQLLSIVADFLNRKKAYHTISKVWLIDRGVATLNGEEKQLSMIGGVVAGPLREGNISEMWEGEIIFIPHQRYKDVNKSELMKGPLNTIITRNPTRQLLEEEFEVIKN